MLTRVSFSKRGRSWLLGRLLFCSSSGFLLYLFLCPPSNVGAWLGLSSLCPLSLRAPSPEAMQAVSQVTLGPEL